MESGDNIMISKAEYQDFIAWKEVWYDSNTNEDDERSYVDKESVSIDSIEACMKNANDVNDYTVITSDDKFSTSSLSSRYVNTSTKEHTSLPIKVAKRGEDISFSISSSSSTSVVSSSSSSVSSRSFTIQAMNVGKEKRKLNRYISNGTFK